MSASRQIAVAVILLVAAAVGWLTYERGWFSAAPPANEQAAVNAGPGAVAPGTRRNGTGGPPGAAGGPPAARGGPAPVITAAVETDSTGLEVSAVGTVAAVRAITLFPEVTGVVAEIAFKPGMQVTDNQPLVRLDDADQQVAVERARIALDAAKSASDRAGLLAKSNNITSVALDDARIAVQKAEIDVKSAELDLAKRTLLAPFAGTIGLTDVTVGDLINSQKPIATLDDMSTVTVAFEVPERASGQVVIGQDVTATTDALAGQKFTGKVTAIDSRVDPVARTLKVEAALANDANVVKPGMALTVAIAFPGVPHAVVPSLAVQWDRNGPYVWKLAGDMVHRAGVEIIGRRSGTVIVAGDIAIGDEVVVEGLQRLREGATVSRPGAGGAQSRPAADAAKPPGSG